MSGNLAIGDRDVLLVVDIQNDFCPEGRLAVPRGDEVVPLINQLGTRFEHVVLTQDWHPPGHLSFASAHPGRKPYEKIEVSYGPQILWPDHCVQGTRGAAFHTDLQIPRAELVLRKGYHRTINSYSAFYENDRRTHTGLTGYLRERGFTRLFLAGLAFDFCVRYSSEDAKREGFDVLVIEDACRGIDVDGSVLATRQRFRCHRGRLRLRRRHRLNRGRAMMQAFASLYSHGFVRIASCVPRTKVADVPANLAETIRLAEVGGRGSAAIMVFPELGLSSYAIDDLLFQDALLASVEAAIDELLNVSRGLYPVLVVGAPLRSAGGLFNTAVVIHRGSLLGVVPKTYLPNYREFYEKRHFSSGAGIRGRQIEVAGRRAPFGTDLLFRSTGSVDVTFHVELCEDFWAPLPPSTTAALAGAEVLINLSASNITIGKADTRRLLCASQSARAIAAYAYSAAGPGESTTDLAWDGHAAIFECGDRLAETERFAPEFDLGYG